MNIKQMLKRSKADTRFVRNAILEEKGLLYGRSFWRPILSRWLVWLGCSWAIGSVLIFAPFISKAIKAMFQ